MAGHVLEWYANCLSGELDSFPGSQLSKLAQLAKVVFYSQESPPIMDLKSGILNINNLCIVLHLDTCGRVMDTNCDDMKL